MVSEQDISTIYRHIQPTSGLLHPSQSPADFVFYHYPPVMTVSCVTNPSADLSSAAVLSVSVPAAEAGIQQMSAQEKIVGTSMATLTNGYPFSILLIPKLLVDTILNHFSLHKICTYFSLNLSYMPCSL